LLFYRALFISIAPLLEKMLLFLTSSRFELVCSSSYGRGIVPKKKSFANVPTKVCVEFDSRVFPEQPLQRNPISAGLDLKKISFCLAVFAFVSIGTCVRAAPVDPDRRAADTDKWAVDADKWPRWLESATPVGRARSVMLVDSAPARSTGASRSSFDETESLLQWTESALRLIQKYQENPQRAARALALLHAAMYDAFVLSARDGVDAGSATVAAHRAASLVLAYLHPYESENWIEGKGLALAYASARAHALSPAQRARELAIGEQVASDAIRRALTDGADRRNAGLRPPVPGPGTWRATPPLNVHTPQEPLAGEWRAWVPATTEIRPPPPPEYDSPRFSSNAEEVYRIWQKLTPEQKTIAENWNLQAGSVTPPGVWNLRAVAAIRAHKLEPAHAARLLATLNVAMNDAAIACWRAKYQWWIVRPVTVIRERFDPEFLPHLVTPPHPSYTSGHASVSGAAEVALTAFFPREAPEFRAMAEEAAMSRLYGGIHYRSDNDEGLRLGRRVAERVMEQALLPTEPAAQRGSGNVR
jgi:hypothetical protein